MLTKCLVDLKDVPINSEVWENICYVVITIP